MLQAPTLLFERDPVNFNDLLVFSHFHKGGNRGTQLLGDLSKASLLLLVAEPELGIPEFLFLFFEELHFNLT